MSIDEIAIRIKRARKDANMTQAEAAAKLGITYQAISNYERGITRIDTDTLVKLCSVYGVAVSDILGAQAPATPISSCTAAPAPFDLTDAEHDLILAYRKASSDDRAIIDNIVSRYTQSDEASRLA